jgi:hypothetical protein
MVSTCPDMSAEVQPWGLAGEVASTVLMRILVDRPWLICRRLSSVNSILVRMKKLSRVVKQLSL